jgi:hypothetical protein
MRKTPVVLGVLSIIFGALTAVMSLLSAFLMPLFSKLTQLTANLPGQSELQRAQLEAADASFAELGPYVRISSLFFLAMSVALVIVGVGLYRRRAWARRTTIGWAIAGLLLVMGNFIFNAIFLQPHQRAVQHAIYAAHGVTPPFELGPGAQTAMLFLGVLMYCAFPAVLLALIGRRSAEHDFLPATSSTTPAA